MRRAARAFCLIVSSAFSAAQAGQEPSQTLKDGPDAKPSAELREAFDAFSKRLRDVVLVGHFTISGQQDKSLHEERYEIRSVTKMPAGDYWLFQARIKYGEHDLTLPLPLVVKWAGKTPVITLDNVTIPALGTFNARVVINGDRYAGTWDHGEVGGHLFGRIEKRARAGNDRAPGTNPMGAKE
jgi:hypothetical protein